MKVAALLVAAGSGQRAGGGVPKQWRDVAGQRILDHALDAFRAHPKVGEILVVTAPDRLQDVPADVRAVTGGASRTASVRAGLEALSSAPPDWVLIHDAARPGLSSDVIDGVLDGLVTAQAVAPALPVHDALWRGVDGTVDGVVDRTGLWRAQTPQGFHFAPLLAAHRAAPGDAADDVAIAHSAGIAVAISLGAADNFKVTTPEDFARAARILAPKTEEVPKMRIGNGYDVHRFGPGDHVTLCGVDIPHSQGLMGHSDADVGLHTVTDALYGALAEGDIGTHFPPSDPQWKGAASHIFLDHAVERVAAHGLSIANVDLTLVCEVPKIGPHQLALRTRLAEILKIDIARVSVKATTTERLGFTGRGEGIAALATVLLV